MSWYNKNNTGYLGIFANRSELDAYTSADPSSLVFGAIATIAGVPSVYRGPGVGWVAQYTRSLSDRMPGPADNLSLGYAIGDVWRYKKELYVCVSSSTSDATWSLLRSGSYGIGDVAKSKIACVGGTIRCVSTYVGYAIDISVLVNAVPTTASIGFDAAGELDAMALANLTSQMDSNTKITVTKIYDQSGSGNHFVQSGSLGMPVLDWSTQQSRYVICGNNKDTVATLTSPSVSFNESDLSLVVVGEASNFSNSNCSIGCFGTASASAFCSIQADASGQIVDNYYGGSRYPSVGLSMEATPCVVQFTKATNSRTWSCNERAGTSTAATGAGTLTGAWINTNAYKLAASGVRGCVWAFYSSALTSAELAKIRYAAYRRCNILPQRRNVLFFIGDSRVEGVKTTAYRTLAIAVAELLGEAAPIIYSFGVASQQQDAMLSSQIPRLASLVRQGNSHIAVSLSAINDFIIGGLSAAASVNRTKGNVAALKAIGIYAYVFSELATTSTTNQANSRVGEYRALLEADSGWCDGVISVTNSDYAMSPSNTGAYPDGLHPSETLYIRLAKAVVSAVPLRS